MHWKDQIRALLKDLTREELKVVITECSSMLRQDNPCDAILNILRELSADELRSVIGMCSARLRTGKPRDDMRKGGETQKKMQKGRGK